MKTIALILAIFAFFPAAATSAEAKRPNILFILVDDQSPFDLKCYNPKSPLATSHIDRLAREGMVFDGAYHMGSFSGAVCSPSRHMIMSGRTVWHLPNAPQTMQKGLCPPDLEQQTVGQWKLELCASSGGWSNPNHRSKEAKQLPPVQLYDMAKDVGERTNEYKTHPEIVARLTALLKKYIADGRSTPRSPAEK